MNFRHCWVMEMSRGAGGGVLSIDPHARDESAADRVLATHRLMLLALAVGAFAGLLYWAQGDVPELSGMWRWGAVGAFALLVLAVVFDPVLAVWNRWHIVSADAGLRRSRGGVPARRVAFPAGWNSVALVVSPETISAEDWDAAAPALAQGLGYDRAKIDHSRRRVVLTFSRGASPVDGDCVAPFELRKQAVRVGVDEQGRDFWLDTSGHSGVIVAGLPGSGKTVFLRRLVQSFALNPDNRVIVFDGKGTDDFGDLVARNVAVFSGTPDTDETIVEELEGLGRLLQERAGGSRGGGRVVVVVDECQGYTPTKGLTTEEKQARERSAKVLKDLVARGRSLGFLTVLATQKPDADTLPTVLRDNCGLRCSGRLRTSEGEKMVLGDSPGIVQALNVGQMVFDDSRARTLVKVAREP